VRWQAAERPDGLAPATSTRLPAGAASTGALLADTGQPQGIALLARNRSTGLNVRLVQQLAAVAMSCPFR